jgi:RNA polymerase sigma-32 factor
MIADLLRGFRTLPLPAEEQMRLARAYRRTKSPALERRLVESNLRLVVKIARQLDRTRGRCLEDLVQEGCLGLIEGVRRFDPNRGGALTTYAAFWIRAAIMKYTMENVRIVRAVRTRAERVAFFRGVVGSAEVSIDGPVGRDDRALAEVLPDPAPGADELAARSEVVGRVRRAVSALRSQLGARDAMVLNQRLLADDPPSQRALAARGAVTGSRIGQIEGSLRARLRADLGEELAAAA